MRLRGLHKWGRRCVCPSEVEKRERNVRWQRNRDFLNSEVLARASALEESQPSCRARKLRFARSKKQQRHLWRCQGYLTAHHACIGGRRGVDDRALVSVLRRRRPRRLSSSSSEVLPPDDLEDCETDTFDLFSTNSTHFCSFPANIVLLSKKKKKPKQMKAAP